jgi:hypothetical protein
MVYNIWRILSCSVKVLIAETKPVEIPLSSCFWPRIAHCYSICGRLSIALQEHSKTKTVEYLPKIEAQRWGVLRLAAATAASKATWWLRLSSILSDILTASVLGVGQGGPRTFPRQLKRLFWPGGDEQYPISISIHGSAHRPPRGRIRLNRSAD